MKKKSLKKYGDSEIPSLTIEIFVSRDKAFNVFASKQCPGAIHIFGFILFFKNKSIAFILILCESKFNLKIHFYDKGIYLNFSQLYDVFYNHVKLDNLFS